MWVGSLCLITIKTTNNIIGVKIMRSKNIFINSKIKPSLLTLSSDDEYCLPLVNKLYIENSIPLINSGYLNDFSVMVHFIFQISHLATTVLKIGVIKKSSSSKLESKIILVNKNY